MKNLQAERDYLTGRKEDLREKRDAMRKERAAYRAEKEALAAELAALKEDYRVSNMLAAAGCILFPLESICQLATLTSSWNSCCSCLPNKPWRKARMFVLLTHRRI